LIGRSPERRKERERTKRVDFPCIFFNQVNPLILLIPVQTKKNEKKPRKREGRRGRERKRVDFPCISESSKSFNPFNPSSDKKERFVASDNLSAFVGEGYHISSGVRVVEIRSPFFFSGKR
jgi:hypothetical protein